MSSTGVMVPVFGLGSSTSGVKGGIQRSWNFEYCQLPKSKSQQMTLMYMDYHFPQWTSRLIMLNFELCCSLAKLVLTLCDPIDCSRPGFLVSHFPVPLVEFAQTHVQWVGDAIQPSHALSSPSAAFNLPESRSFPVSQLFMSGGQSIGAQLQHQSFQWIFRVDFL